jgi:2-phospho-L-lactate guanylyltransferase
LRHSPIWAVLPVKPFDDAKSRLQPVMDAGPRRDLARALMLLSLATLQACDLIDHVLVVSSDNDALEAATAQGAATLSESGTGLNPALEEARRHALAGGAAGLLVLASDLPLLDLSDVDAMFATGQDAAIVIAPDRRRQGTNALLLRPADSIDFNFGEASYQRHLDLAAAAGLQATEVFRTGLAFDIDLPRDWHDLMSSGWEGLPGLRLVWTRA